MSEQFNRTALGEKKTSPENQNFKVQVSRWKVGFATIGLFALTVFMAVLTIKPPAALVLFSQTMVTLMTVSCACHASLWLRRRPICVIDAQGITDCGVLSKGFGFISWRNVQSVREYRDRGSVCLLVRVNNFDQLIARRNSLLRPSLKFSEFLCGGEVGVPLTYCSTDAQTVLEQIYNYSKKPQLAPPARPLARREQLVVTIRIAAVTLFTVVLLAVAYWLWQHFQNPTLQILGLDSRVQVGKQVWLQEYDVENHGHDTTGIHLEFSGRALDTNLLKNPRVLIEYETKSQIASPFLLMKSREIVPLVQVKKNVWSGDSKRAFLAHKDDMIFSGLHLYSNKFTSAIGWWTDVLGPRLRINLFADIPKIGDENLNLKVVPIEYPNSPATTRNRFASTKEKNFGSGPILSEGVPKDFPVTAYPDSYILWLSAVELKLDSAAAPTAIAAYYKEELNRKGWKTQINDDKPNQTLVVDGLKGKDRITVTINQIPHHTAVDIFLWFKY